MQEPMERKQAPETFIQTDIPIIQPEELVLDNGLKVYLLEGGHEEIVKVELVFFAGSFYQSSPLVAFATAHLLRTGTRNRNATEINKLFDFYGTYFHADAQKDLASFSVFVLQKHFEPVMELYADMIMNPVFPEDELALFLKNQKQQYLINTQRVQYLARTYFNELLFGHQHPYGFRAEAADFDGMDRSDLITFHQDYYHPANAFCIVSGRLPVNIRDLLRSKLGRIDRSNRLRVAPPSYLVEAASEKKVMVQRPNVLQSAIRIGRRLFNRCHPDYYKLMITNTLLGGYFGSRLMQNIRQNKGYTYGIGSGVVSLLRDGYFFVGSEVGIDVCQKAIDEVYRELKSLRTIPATADELNAMKAYLSGDYLRSFDGPFAQSQRFKELLAFRLDASHFEGFLTELKTITAQQIMQTADKYLHEDSMMELVVGRK